METLSVGDARIELVLGDITKEKVDVIVNSANARLGGGYGVDLAIHQAAGPELLDACMDFPQLDPEIRVRDGEAVITPAFRLSAKHVIHAVGPAWRDGRSGEPEALAEAHTHSLRLAASLGARSIAFPAISCGIFGYPVALAAPISLGAVRNFLKNRSILRRVRFLLYSSQDLATFSRALSELR